MLCVLCMYGVGGWNIVMGVSPRMVIGLAVHD